MKFKLMLSSILFGVVLLSAVLSAWKFSHTLSLEKKKQIFHHAEKQTELARAAIESAIEPLEGQLHRLAEAESSLKLTQANPPVLTSQSEKLRNSNLIGLSLIVFNSAENKWRPQWASFNSNHWIQNFDYFQSNLNSLPLARVANGQMTFSRILDRKGQPQIVVLKEIQVNSADQTKQTGILLGLLPIQYFSKLSQVSKAQDQELFLIDSQGYALAYPKQQFLGSKFVNDFISRLASAQKLKNRGVFKDEHGGMMLGVYEKVKGANLYVVYNIPMIPSGELASGLLFDLTFTHLSIGVLAILLVWLLIGPIIGQWEYFRSSIFNLSDKKPLEVAHSLGSKDLQLFEALQRLQNRVLDDTAAADESKGETTDFYVLKDKELVEKLSKGLVESIRGPLAAILGHAQLARSESSDSSTKTHYTVIEREARRSRDILENLKQFLGEEEVENQKCDFQEIILKSIARKRVQLDQRSIRIQKDLNGAAPVMANENQLIQVVEQLIENAIDSMIGSDERILTLKLEITEGNQAVLSVHDTGVGISPDNLKRVFQPFFSTKPKEDNPGLGLSTAKSILEKNNGKITVTSGKGLGSCFVVTMPLVEKSRNKVAATKANKIETFEPKDESAAINIGDTNSSVSILGKEPLTGSTEDDLPVAPEKDEITFVGESEELKLEDQRLSEEGGSLGDGDIEKTRVGGES